MTQPEKDDSPIRKLMAEEGLTYEQARKKMMRALAISLVAAKAADDEAPRKPH